ncbi:hypothetical protein [Sporichthya polymorpha]|uniref:hypothetical protein n=1 Tax=Sporichthya polymorpha TaxID=35751 RepID=UPI00037A50BB|nr:hypothetical protein [Sporichthya polymorpha]
MTSQDRTRGEREEILALAPDATAAEADALLALFASAAGPAATGKLPGEDAAVAAFLEAQPAPAAAGATARRAKVLAALTGLFTLKTAAVALAVTSVGGAAIAASTGVLPTPLTDKKTTVEQPDPPRADAEAVRDAAKTAAAADRADADAGRTAEASYSGLCQAFTAGAWTNERAAGNPAFSRLVETAPAGDVTAFCTALDAETTSPNGKTPPGRAKSDAAKDRQGPSEKGTEARERRADNGKAPAEKAGGQPADRGPGQAAEKKSGNAAGKDRAPKKKPIAGERGHRPTGVGSVTSGP